LKLFEQKESDPAEVIPPTRSAPTRYSQPLPASQRESPPVVFPGFVHGQPGFILRRCRGQKEIRVEAGPENKAKEQPGGFAAALGKLWAAVGGRK
jgi:hypothetical protein